MTIPILFLILFTLTIPPTIIMVAWALSSNKQQPIQLKTKPQTTPQTQPLDKNPEMWYNTQETNPILESPTFNDKLTPYFTTESNECSPDCNCITCELLRSLNNHT